MSTIEELLADEEAVQRGGRQLSAELAQVTGESGDALVHVRVDLNGKPIALELSSQAMRLTASELAERIRAHAGHAAGLALRAGLERVHRDCGAEVAVQAAERSPDIDVPALPPEMLPPAVGRRDPAPAPVRPAPAPAPTPAASAPSDLDDDDDEPFEYQPRSDW